MTNKHVDAGMHEHVSVPYFEIRIAQANQKHLILRRVPSVQYPAKCDPCSTLTLLNAFC
jgi:hypothetical protein